ncbi:1,3-propanediol dehydrogenase [Roseibium sp. TrichSKD4]|uniref:iron-containing alcohol dehydrogenase n=1 Tax=Roseibium sp. TrichSKD4 TaxID=744980 RepID=UPI0001E56143|nr:iron-containing alcohol dehydrogenase [Roseibium sp. TrichSKD4]EFO33709.1 1,3-propanediol dehydrogenase [Roseibium sp. TrichSKD4]
MATINYLTRVEFDFGALRLLPRELKSLKIERPLVVTDKGIAATPIFDQLLSLVPSNMQLFDGTPSNPTEAAIEEAGQVYSKRNCDGVIAFGGGSSLDLAKGVRLRVSHEGPLVEYAAIEGGIPRIHGNMPPLIAIPTTAGTGSEVGRGAVINFSDGQKLGVLSPHNLPSVALCDPTLTTGLPAGLTAATGMDAISHCLETYMAPSINPPADAIALEGLVRGFAALPRAVKDGTDQQARWDMMMASMEGALAFQKGLGAVHALTHPLGAVKDVNLHHGTLNAILMPPVLRFNKSEIGAKWDRLTEILDGEPDQVIDALNRQIGIPNRLSDLGVTGAHVDEVAKAALLDHCHATNPRQADENDYRAILEEVF